MLVRILTGGQTGVDQAAWRAARAAGFPTGGWMPRGFRTEDGPRPDLAALHGAAEHSSDEWAARTIANVAEADATLILLGAQPGPGTELTITAAREARVPLLVVRIEDSTADAAVVAGWIRAHEVRTLNVAGDRESVEPGIGVRAEVFLEAVFRRMLEEVSDSGRSHG